MKNYVWEFTNQRKLNKKEFLHYVEKKVFKTIRKYDMLPEDRKIILKDDGFFNFRFDGSRAANSTTL